jgi:aminoglycoside phosphotransferase (APT) family kinase protein
MTSDSPLNPSPEPSPDEAALSHVLVRMSLVSANQLIHLKPLAGGVSSDIYRADLPSGVVCVKRALPRLRVAAEWNVPVERNRYEVEWMRVAAEVVPHAVPRLLGEDRETGAFAMTWLPPERYPVWKALLAEGAGTRIMARHVGDVLGRIHAATADRPDLLARFPTDALFHALRLDPYLVTAGRVNPECAVRLNELVAITAKTKRVLVHGDFSPKNILIGPDGPVILDAECAWYGDPAFDLAFVLNHLMLKSAWRPQRREQYAAMAGELVAAYHSHATWEPWHALDARAAALLPGLLLARIDGKSPVEYLTSEDARAAVRGFARHHLRAPAPTLEQLMHSFAP